MRGKGIFVREEVGLSVKGKEGFVCGKGFSYAEARTILSEGRGGVVPRCRKRCSQKKGALCAGEGDAFRGQTYLHAHAEKLSYARRKISMCTKISLP